MARTQLLMTDKIHKVVVYKCEENRDFGIEVDFDAYREHTDSYVEPGTGELLESSILDDVMGSEDISEAEEAEEEQIEEGGEEIQLKDIEFSKYDRKNAFTDVIHKIELVQHGECNYEEGYDMEDEFLDKEYGVQPESRMKRKREGFYVCKGEIELEEREVDVQKRPVKRIKLDEKVKEEGEAFWSEALKTALQDFIDRAEEIKLAQKVPLKNFPKLLSEEAAKLAFLAKRDHPKGNLTGRVVQRAADVLGLSAASVRSNLLKAMAAKETLGNTLEAAVQSFSRAVRNFGKGIRTGAKIQHSKIVFSAYEICVSRLEALFAWNRFRGLEMADALAAKRTHLDERLVRISSPLTDGSVSITHEILAHFSACISDPALPRPCQ